MHQLNRSLFLTCTHTLPPQLLLLPLAPGRAREEEWNPKMKPQGCIWLCIAWDCQGWTKNGMGVGFSSNTGTSGPSRSPERKKKIPKKRRKPCWSAIAKPICMVQSWDQTQDCNKVTELLLPERCAALSCAEEMRETFVFGAAPDLKPGIVLCIQPTHSETFAPPCGASGTRWIPARNLLPPRTTSFSGINLCKTSKGAFYQKLFTHSAFAHSTCRKQLGDVLYLHSFKKINLLLTYCLPE